MTSSMRQVEALRHRASHFQIASDGGLGGDGNAERRSWLPVTGSSKTFSISKSDHRNKKRLSRKSTVNVVTRDARNSSRIFTVLALAAFVGGWSVCIERSHAIQAESQSEKEANLKGQAQGGLFNRWTFDQEKSGEAPAGFSMLGFGEGPAADWRIKEDRGAPSASNILTVNSSCQAVNCYRVIVADGFQYEYPDLSVRMRFPVDAAAGGGGAVFGLKDAAHFYAVVVDLAAKTLEVSRVVDGKETRLGRASIMPKALPWHMLRIQRNTIISKDFIETFFDGQLAVTVEDQSLAAGQVGLLVRGQIVMDFDSLHAIPLFSHRPLSAPAAY
jgi:hypothetical protein